MKKTIHILLTISILFFFVVSPVLGNSAKDYKVIKKAVKGDNDDVTVFKILVTDKKAKKVKVSITLPISLLDWITDHCHGRIDLGDHCRLELRSLIKKLKRGEPLAIIEIDDGDETVKIWFE